MASCCVFAEACCAFPGGCSVFVRDRGEVRFVERNEQVWKLQVAVVAVGIVARPCFGKEWRMLEAYCAESFPTWTPFLPSGQHDLVHRSSWKLVGSGDCS